MKYLKIKDWKSFQHYKDRNPPWIKLDTHLFQNYEFSFLQDASKLLAICIWTLASRYKDPKLGIVPNDLKWIKQQCALGDFVQDEHLQELVNSGYLVYASDMLADCNQSAMPETETYSKETETKTEREALTKNFKDLKISEEGKSFAAENGIITENLLKCWRKFKIHYEANPPDEWLALWKKWVLNERVNIALPEAKSSSDDVLQGDELLAQQLGAVIWLRERKMFVSSQQAKSFEEFERKSGIKVTWRNVREWKEQGSISLKIKQED